MSKEDNNERADEKQAGSGDKWIFFSRELAEQLGGMDGIPGAIITYGVYGWIIAQQNRIRLNHFAYNPKINGETAAYRSLRELEARYCGLWHHSTIDAILKRTEGKSVGLTVDRSRKQLHFSMSDGLKKMHSHRMSDYKLGKEGFLGCLTNDALKYGLLPALFRTNLTYQVTEFPNPITDDAGAKYGELSPTKLSQRVDKHGKPDPKGQRVFPVSYDAAKDAIKSLRVNGDIVPHATKTSFYRLPLAGEAPKPDGAKVDTHGAKIDTCGAKIDSDVSRNERKTDVASDLCTNEACLICSIDSNLHRKYLFPPSVSLRSTDGGLASDLSAGAKKLMELVNEGLSAFRQRDKATVAPFNINDYAVYRVDDSGQRHVVSYDFFYDFIPASDISGKPYTRTTELEEFVAAMEMDFISRGFPYTKAELAEFRQLFIKHPYLNAEHLIDLLCHELMEGIPDAPTKGHDYYFFARRINSAKLFLRYLPQLIMEKFVGGRYRIEDCYTYEEIYHPETKQPIFNYLDMEQPYFDIVFADGKRPVTYIEVYTQETAQAQIKVLSASGYPIDHSTVPVEVINTRIKPVFYADSYEGEFVSMEGHTFRPEYPLYAEMLALPLLRREIPDDIIRSQAEQRTIDRQAQEAA